MPIFQNKPSMITLGCASGLALILAACSQDADPALEASTPPAAAADSSEAVSPSPLQAVLESAVRSEDAKARDVWRNPEATLTFFGVEADDTVVEIWPGGGWYTQILAPFLKDEGAYIAAGFDPNANEFFADATERFNATFLGQVETYGDITQTELSPTSEAIAPPGSADFVLTFRNVHNWMAAGFAEKAFADMYAALKPGGTLGVVEHRLPSAETQDPQAANGYVHEGFVKALASEAGFEFIESSEINANVNDSTNHPFGVWTLPPVSRTTDRDGNAPDGFDASVYAAIGESDRMTLKFRKPIAQTSDPDLETNSED